MYHFVLTFVSSIWIISSETWIKIKKYGQFWKLLYWIVFGETLSKIRIKDSFEILKTSAFTFDFWQSFSWDNSDRTHLGQKKTKLFQSLNLRILNLFKRILHKSCYKCFKYFRIMQKSGDIYQVTNIRKLEHSQWLT